MTADWPRSRKSKSIGTILCAEHWYCLKQSHGLLGTSLPPEQLSQHQAYWLSATVFSPWENIPTRCPGNKVCHRWLWQSFSRRKRWTAHSGHTQNHRSVNCRLSVWDGETWMRAIQHLCSGTTHRMYQATAWCYQEEQAPPIQHSTYTPEDESTGTYGGTEKLLLPLL